MADHVRSRGARNRTSPGSPTAHAGVANDPSLDAVSRDADATGPRFAAATTRLGNGAPVVSVTGEVDLATAPRLERTLLRLTGEQTHGVIVDLTDCSFLDSRGLSALLSARSALGASDRPLSLVLSNPTMLKMLQLTQLDALFDIYPTLSDAGDCDSDD